MNIKLLLLCGFLIAVYIFLLSLNLLKLPLYLDEGLYIFWASLIKENVGFAYTSMQDGKTPLFIWLTYYLNTLFNNYLYTARFISVIASAITLICTSIIAFKIAGKRAAFFVWVLFLVTPFNILVSRMAFVDSLLISFGSLSLLFLFLTNRFAQKKKVFISLFTAILSGIFLGLAFMTKTTAKIFLVAEILILVTWSWPLIKKRQYKAGVLLLASIPIIAGLYFELLGYLRFGASRYWEMISNKESNLIFSLPEILKNLVNHEAFIFYLKNVPLYFEYLLIYLGPILIFFFLGIFAVIKTRKHLWLLLMLFIFGGGVFLSAKIPASRYLAIIIPSFVLVSAIGLNNLWQKKTKLFKVLSLALILVGSFFSLKLIFDPLNALYSSDDESYFITSEINASGLEEIIKYLEPRKDETVIGIEGTWGVTEGMLTRLEEGGIKTRVVEKIIPISGSVEKNCSGGYRDEEDLCWKANFGPLYDFPQTEKYIYLTATEERVEFFKKIAHVSIVKEFKRPRNGATSYLIKINP